MYQRIHFLSALACGLALAGSAAHAQLQLSGHITGWFDDLAEANTTVTNSADHSHAVFQTGVAAEGSTQSRIEFTNAAFTNVGSGEPIQVGLFDITNGKTLIGSGAPTARFHVGLHLTDPALQDVAVSTVTFHIDHTPNTPGAVPDTFGITFDQPPPLKIENTLVQFHLNVTPADFQVAEDATTQKGDITVTFTPVPEPSTYAAWGAALLIGLVGLRRLRAGKASASAPTAG